MSDKTKATVAKADPSKPATPPSGNHPTKPAPTPPQPKAALPKPPKPPNPKPSKAGQRTSVSVATVAAAGLGKSESDHVHEYALPIGLGGVKRWHSACLKGDDSRHGQAAKAEGMEPKRYSRSAASTLPGLCVGCSGELSLDPPSKRKGLGESHGEEPSIQEIKKSVNDTSKYLNGARLHYHHLCEAQKLSKAEAADRHARLCSSYLRAAGYDPEQGVPDVVRDPAGVDLSKSSYALDRAMGMLPLVKADKPSVRDLAAQLSPKSDRLSVTPSSAGGQALQSLPRAPYSTDPALRTKFSDDAVSASLAANRSRTPEAHRKAAEAHALASSVFGGSSEGADHSRLVRHHLQLAMRGAQKPVQKALSAPPGGSMMPGSMVQEPMMMGEKPGLPKYSEKKGWQGGEKNRLYHITDKRTGDVQVRPIEHMRGVGPEVAIRHATRSEAESHYQKPLHSGWKVEDDVAKSVEQPVGDPLAKMRAHMQSMTKGCGSK